MKDAKIPCPKGKTSKEFYHKFQTNKPLIFRAPQMLFMELDGKVRIK